MEPVLDTAPRFSDCADDDERFEFAQYIVNTPPEDRPEISTSEAAEALAWMEAQS